MDKYIGKYRIIVIQTKDDKNADYVKAMNKLPKYKKQFDKLATIIIVSYSDRFSISLYGMDSSIKYTSQDFTSWKTFIDIINSMDMQKYVIKLIKSDKKIGYANKEMAKYTLNLLKNQPEKIKFLVINTLYNEAKYSSIETPYMHDAIKIYKNWLDLYNSN